MHSWNLAAGDELLPGRTVVELLGGGKRHEAYLAWDASRLALVVVKALRPDLVEDERALAALRREADLLAGSSHPHLVRGYGADLEGERPALTLEHVEGPRLSTLLRRYGLALEQLLPLAQAVASALHHLHGRGIVHLDVKPSNIVMSGPPKLIDLSVARPIGELDRLTSPAGTHGYMAPEQFDVDRFGELGPPADVWGLGATLDQALGHAAPPAVRAIADAALSPRPGDRPTAAEMHAALEPIVAAAPAPRLGRLRPGARRAMADLTAR